ncbi:MAG: hypothetical protein ACC619_00690 [Paracoccaceae bacterium]
MQTIQSGYRGLTLLVNLNWDRLLYGATIAGALVLGAWVGGL